jgi:hypothetical protein
VEFSPCVHFFLVLLVYDSEYSQSAGAKPILSPSCIYLVSPGALRAPTRTRPPFMGEGKYQKKQKMKIVGAGVVAACVSLLGCRLFLFFC